MRTTASDPDRKLQEPSCTPRGWLRLRLLRHAEEERTRHTKRTRCPHCVGAQTTRLVACKVATAFCVACSSVVVAWMARTHDAAAAAARMMLGDATMRPEHRSPAAHLEEVRKASRAGQMKFERNIALFQFC